MDHKKYSFWARVSWPLTYRKGWIIEKWEGETLNHTLHVCVQHSLYEQVKFPEARADRFLQILKGGLDRKKCENHQFRRTQKSDCKNLYSINYFVPNEQIKLLAAIHEWCQWYLFFIYYAVIWFLRIIKTANYYYYARYITNLLNFHWILTTVFWGMYHLLFHFTVGKTEA